MEAYKENVEKKRELDVKMIQLRQCLTIPFVEPLPTEAFTRLQSNQIWEMILEYLVNSLDMYSAKNTCPQFQDIMSTLPNAAPDELEVSAVLKIMRKGGYSHAWDHNPSQFRLVSKSWQRAADQALRTEFEGEWYLHLGNGRWWKDYVNITKIQNVDLAWNVLDKSISRSSLLQIIRVNENCLNEMGIAYPRILEFLDELGESVKGLVVEWTDRSVSVANKYMNLLSLVARMPNLKAVTIDTKIWYPSDQPEEVADEIKDLILHHRFPSYPSLEVLSLRGYYPPPLEKPLIHLVAEILSRSSNLKSIGMPECILEAEPVTGALEGQLIQFIDCQMNRLRPRILPLLTDLPLRKILFPKYMYGDKNLIYLLNHFEDTLEYLELPRMNLTFIGGRVSLELPKLKTLILETSPDLNDLDVLLPFSGLLEHLEFAYNNSCCSNYKNPEEKVRFIQRNNLLKLEISKIWECFPNLRFVKIRVNVREKARETYVFSPYRRSYRDENNYGMQVICHYFRRGKEITMEKCETLC